MDDIGVRFVKYYWIFFEELFRFREIRRVLNVEKDSFETEYNIESLSSSVLNKNSPGNVHMADMVL